MKILPNRAGGFAVQKNLEFLGDIKYSEEEKKFAYKIQEATEKPMVGIDGKIKPMKPTEEKPMGGSTDVGDVSFLVPVVRLGLQQHQREHPGIHGLLLLQEGCQ